MDDALLIDDRLAESLCARNAFYVPTLRILCLAKTPETLPIGKQNLKRFWGDRRSHCTWHRFGRRPRRYATGAEHDQGNGTDGRGGAEHRAVIRAATRDAAEYIGLLKDIGTVEPGKLADLIIVDGDPLKDITVMEKVKVVVQAGRIVYDANSK